VLILILGLVVFFSVHSVRMVAGGFREAQLAANEQRWKGVYALLSLVGFALIIWGWIAFRGEAPEFYEPPTWGRHLAMALVWLAFIATAAASMPAGRMKVFLKHPMLAGVILWSVGHLFANGDLASVLLFGAFLLYSVINRLAVIPRGDPAPVVVQPRSDLMAVLAGTALYVFFVLWLHGWLFGVSLLG